MRYSDGYTVSEWCDVWYDIATEIGVADADLEEFFEKGLENCIDDPE